MAMSTGITLSWAPVSSKKVPSWAVPSCTTLPVRKGMSAQTGGSVLGSTTFGSGSHVRRLSTTTEKRSSTSDGGGTVSLKSVSM